MHYGAPQQLYNVGAVQQTAKWLQYGDFPTKLPFSVRSCEVNWKKMFIWNSDLVSLILLNFQKKNVSLTETNHYLLSCSLDRVGYLQINLAPHSQPRTKLAQRHCDSFTSRVAGHSCGMCEPSQCSAPLKKLSSPTINSTVCVCVCWKIAMLDIALLDVTSTSRLTQREWPPWCSKLCRLTSENGVTRWRILFYKI